MSLPEQTLREGFDMRVVWALRMVGINLGSHLWQTGRRKGHKITFTCVGDREMVHGVLTDFIADEFNGVNCQFFAVQNDPRECYVIFDEGRTQQS